ncbi:hypothetical protein HY486_04610 [Candidatus Woesearchaeota archaeon]|nr:hypothetical protein [Candidatus Woesearchaeota archaeon]
MEYKLLISLGFIVGGVVAALIIGAVVNYFTKGIVKWAKARQDVGHQVMFAIKLAKLFLQVSILLIFITQATSMFGFDVLTQLTQKVALYLPKLIIASIIIIIGIYLAKLAETACLKTTLSQKKNIAIGAYALVLVLFILAGLEIAELQIKVLTETYKIVLYTVGAIAALAIGIPLGMRAGIRKAK